jgi:two-component system chemotaxis response regulator CheY
MKIHALVVDDSIQLRRSVMFALQKIPDVVCDEAGDGAEALRKLRARSFDIVLSDINMPMLDGLKLVAHIRADPAFLKLPVVMITTESAEADRERALRLGANAYLVKPIQAGAVVETVKSLLGLHERSES